MLLDAPVAATPVFRIPGRRPAVLAVMRRAGPRAGRGRRRVGGTGLDGFVAGVVAAVGLGLVCYGAPIAAAVKVGGWFRAVG